MFKIIALGALLVCCAVMTRAVPVDQTELDEMAEAPVAGVSQTSQAVVEQEPKISAPKESDVEMSEQNKEAMENAETIGFGYHRDVPRGAPRVRSAVPAAVPCRWRVRIRRSGDSELWRIWRLCGVLEIVWPSTKRK
ncbi:hypothetical protein pipiens_008020 [Culex pipiens pipiens]|uniref:Secreted protein n=1 Tax=Culex pipiens pipiens TaxID=38569 RepID=A0ABD1DIW4_CULPP